MCVCACVCVTLLKTGYYKCSEQRQRQVQTKLTLDAGHLVNDLSQRASQIMEVNGAEGTNVSTGVVF